MKKDKIIKEVIEVTKTLKLSIATIKHDNNMMTEIQENDKITMEENTKEKESQHKEITKLEKANEAIKIELEETRETNATLNKDNSDLKTQLKVKDGIVKAIKEANKVDEEVTVLSDSEIPPHRCTACDKNFRASNDLEKHIEAKHTEMPCVYCEKNFRSEEALKKHHKACTKNVGLANSICNKCNQKFTENGLKRHYQNCHAYNPKFDCPECGQMCESLKAMKTHQNKEHEYEPVRSRVVCKHWRRGHCSKGNLCSFSHVGQQQNNETQENNRNTIRVPACQNGPSCDWLSKGCCSYFHPRVGVQKQWNNRQDQRRGRQHHGQGRQDLGQGRQDQAHGRQDQGRGRQGQGQSRRQEYRSSQEPNSRQDRATCKFDGRCDRIPNCPYMHYQEDFPPFQGRRNPVTGRRQNQRKN